MKLKMATVINFNINKSINNSHVMLHNNPGYRDLINRAQFFDRLLKLSHNIDRRDVYLAKYRKGFLAGDLNFKDLDFRKRYLKWIYTHYSNSVANHQMVQQNETNIFIKWAKRFNSQDHNLKVIKVIPRVSQSYFHAYLWLIPFSTDHQLSFKLKNALTEKYGIDYDRAFYQFESMVGKVMASDIQDTFNTCIPGINLHLENNPMAIVDNVSELEPVKRRNYHNYKDKHNQKRAKKRVVKPDFPHNNKGKHRHQDHRIVKPKPLKRLSFRPMLLLLKYEVSKKPSLNSNLGRELYILNTVPVSQVYRIEIYVALASLQADLLKPKVRPKKKIVVKRPTQPKRRQNNQNTKDSGALDRLSHTKDYIAIVIIISFIIILALIIIFPLFKF